MADEVSKSWFCVINNPRDNGFIGTDKEILDEICDLWICSGVNRSCALTFCLSADGLEHIHGVFEDSKAMRFSAVKRIFPKAHIESTKGNKQQSLDYINKVGVFEEKGELIKESLIHGIIQGCQGKRNDLDRIAELIDSGYTPQQILDINISYRRYEKIVKDTFYAKRNKETPFLRDVYVEWHCGESGSGKSYEMVKCIEEYGEDSLYLMTDYESGGFDKYNGEDILFLDEFRGQIKYTTLLSILQGYKCQFHSRYTNIVGLWSKVYITSVLPPEMVYKNMVSENREIDTIKQLFRRIDKIVYHYKLNGEYKKHIVDMKDYINYEQLKYDLENNAGQFCKVDDNVISEVPAEFL